MILSKADKAKLKRNKKNGDPLAYQRRSLELPENIWLQGFYYGKIPGRDCLDLYAPAPKSNMKGLNKSAGGHVVFNKNLNAIRSDSNPTKLKEFIWSSIRIPKYTCRIYFEVSGKFQIGIAKPEEGKCQYEVWKKPIFHGLTWPTRKSVEGGLEKLRIKRGRKGKKPKVQTVDTSPQEPQLLQMLIDYSQEYATIQYALDGIRCTESFPVENLKELIEQDLEYDEKRKCNVWCMMSSTHNAQVKYLRTSNPAEDRLIFLFVAKHCPQSVGQLPYGLFRELSEFV